MILDNIGIHKRRGRPVSIRDPKGRGGRIMAISRHVPRESGLNEGEFKHVPWTRLAHFLGSCPPLTTYRDEWPMLQIFFQLAGGWSASGGFL